MLHRGVPVLSFSFVRMLKFLSLIVVMTCAVICSPAKAWDNFGHMEVAAYAWAKMTPTAQARAAQLLKLNPMYAIWTANIPADQRDRVAFVMAATWPDAIKRSTDYHSDGADGGDRPPPGPEASQNIGYADHFMHKYWHFIDLPFSPDNTTLHDPVAPNAQTQIAAFRAKLADAGATDDVQSYDLAWLLHLVGDVHQPLHATSRFTHGQPDGDAGGNGVKIKCGTGCSAPKLHTFWDDVLGTSNAVNDAILAATKLRKPGVQKVAISDEKKWIDESFSAAKDYVYDPPVGDGAGPYTLTKQYKARALRLAKQRVALAGARLANLLNDAFK